MQPKQPNQPNQTSRNAISAHPVTMEEITDKMKGAVDNNATDNPHLSIDQDKGKMAVIGDATALDVPTYKYEIEYEYTDDMLTAEDKKNLRYDDITDRYYLTLTYENKRVKPIYRTKVVMLLTSILADLSVVDASGYSSEQMDTMMIQKVVDDHVDEILDIAHVVLGVEKTELEYMTVISLVTFLTNLLANEPNIIGECVNFLSQSRKQLAKKKSVEKK